MSENYSQSTPVDLTQALAITTKSGQLRLFKTSVLLSIENGGLVKPGGMPAALVTAEGYKWQGRQAGLQVLNAPSVVVDGIQQKNPHVQRDANGQVLVVTCRSFCAGYTVIGVPVVTDRTVVFDLLAYQAVDLIQKAKNLPDVFKLMDAHSKPRPGWSAYPIDGVKHLRAEAKPCPELHGKKRRQHGSNLSYPFTPIPLKWYCAI